MCRGPGLDRGPQARGPYPILRRGSAVCLHTVSEKIALHFHLNYKAMYSHVMKLVVEGRLYQERGRRVVGNERIAPSALPVQQRFDF
jgi:hypothetical protein